MKTAIFAHPEISAVDLKAHLPLGTTELVTGEGLLLEESARSCARALGISIRVFPRTGGDDALRNEILGYTTCVLAVTTRGKCLCVPGVERALSLGIPVAFAMLGAREFTRA